MNLLIRIVMIILMFFGIIRSWIGNFMHSSNISCNSDATLTRTTPEDMLSEFWQQWNEQKDQLYRCCLKLMNFNSTDAEDALSQAMLKAWEKVQKYAGKIDNLKAWLVQLTRNLCIDIIRQRSKGAAGVDSLEWAPQDNVDTASAVETPEKALEKDEKARVMKEAIASLPERLRETFILHFYQQRSHSEIAEEQGITYDNVCKRISLARKELKERLSGYFQGSLERVSSKVSPCSEDKGIKELRKEKLESVECSVQPREEAAPVVEETTTVSAQKECKDQVNEENLEAVERKVLPKEKVSKNRTDVVEARGKNLLCRGVSVSWLSNIVAFLERLGERFILHFYQQRSYREIAAAHRKTNENESMPIFLARKEQKQRLKRNYRRTLAEVTLTASSRDSASARAKKQKHQGTEDKSVWVEYCVGPTVATAPEVMEMRADYEPKPCFDQGMLKTKMGLREKNSSHMSEMGSINVRYLNSLRNREGRESSMNNLQSTMAKVLSMMLVATLMLFTFNSPAYAGGKAIVMECDSASPTYILEATDSSGYQWTNTCGGRTLFHVAVVPTNRWNYGNNYPHNLMVPATGNTKISVPPPPSFPAPKCRQAELVLKTDGTPKIDYCYHLLGPDHTISLEAGKTVTLVQNDSYYPNNHGFQSITLSNTVQ